MTDFDSQADIELYSADGHVTVRVPLAGAVTGKWLRCHQKLALATKLSAQAQARHDRAWIVVSMPATSDQGEVAATMDAARALIAEADAAAERPPATVQVEAGVRDWWAGWRGSAPPSPVSEPGVAGVRAEKRWPMACTLVLAMAMAVPLLLPPRFSLGQSWAVPALEALLLVAIVAIDRGRIDRRSAAGRARLLRMITGRVGGRPGSEPGTPAPPAPGRACPGPGAARGHRRQGPSVRVPAHDGTGSAHK